MGDRESNPLRGDLHTMLEPALIEIGTSAIESVPLISTGRGAGSGVVWSDDGLIVTNNHVALSPTVRASFASGDSYGARVIARNPALDLALLKTTTDVRLRPMEREVSQVAPGRLVIAVGNPLGLRHVLTVGVIVAANSQTAVPAMPGQSGFIQTDVVLAPGNSGGALLDSQGRLLGINTLVVSRASFAIPTAVVASFVERTLARLAGGPCPVNGDGRTQ